METKTISIRLFPHDIEMIEEIKKYQSELYNNLDPDFNHTISTTAAIQYALKKCCQYIQQNNR